jgi:UDP-glucose 4-epimerase
MAAKTYRSVVTGATGFIGSHMVEALAAGGHEIVATDLPSAFEASGKIARMSADLVRAKAARIVPADITDPGALDAAVDGADFVFHTASVSDGSSPWKVLYRVNVQGTANLIDSIARTTPGLRRLVAWGTGGVYGLPSPDRIPLTEDLPPDPINDSLKSKWFEEFLVMDRCPRAGIRYSILRPTTVYGTRQVHGLPDLFRAAWRGPVVAIPVNLTGRVPFVHVDDVCGAALHLAKYASGENGVFNVSDDSRMTTVEAFRFLSLTLDKPFLALPPVPIRPVRQILGGVAEASRWLGLKIGLEKDTIACFGEDFVFSNEKLKAAGYELRHPDPKAALIETANWLVENGLIQGGST